LHFFDLVQKEHRHNQAVEKVRVPLRVQILDLSHVVDRQAITRSISDKQDDTLPVHMIEQINKVVASPATLCRCADESRTDDEVA
jgi:hypothetical protein